MKRNCYLFAICLALTLGIRTSSGQGTAFTYQGRLDSAGQPVEGTYDFRFTLYDALAGGNVVAGPINTNGATIHIGAVEVFLDFGPGVFTGALRWLEISVRTNGTGLFSVLAPRLLLSPTPYALYAASGNPGPVGPQGVEGPQGPAGPKGDTGPAGAQGLPGVKGDKGDPGAVGPIGPQGPQGPKGDLGAPGVAGLTGPQGPPGTNGLDGAVGPQGPPGAPGSADAWGLKGTTGTTAGPNFVGTLDNQALEFKVNNDRAFRLEPRPSSTPNVVGGSSANWVKAGVSGATIAGGGTLNWHGVVGVNQVEADLAAIAGGLGNAIGDSAAFAVVGGGSGNSIGTNSYTTVIGGGSGNAIADNSYYSTIGGGVGNWVSNWSIAVWIGGGAQNLIGGTNDYSVIAGGGMNQILDGSGSSAIVGGGRHAIGPNSPYGFIGGGTQNAINPGNWVATVGGGALNQAGGWYSTVPGGKANEAGADFTLAAGYRAKARNRGSFVWADSTEADFVSSANDQFSVRAAGGARFETGGTGMMLDGRPVVTSYGTGSGLDINTSGGFSDPQLLITQSNPADWARIRLEAGGPAWDIALSPGTQPVLNFWNGSANVLSLAQNGDATLTGSLSFGTGALRQMLDLWAGQHGIGVQSWTTYFRTIGGGANGAFAWYKGGSHADGHLDPGGGQTLMRLDGSGLAVSTPSTVNLADANHLIVGPLGDANNALSLGYTINNTISAYGIIQARENGAPTALQINPFGGQVFIGGPILSWSLSPNNSLTSDLGGAIELGNSFALFATPYIDFHYGVNGPEDYNVRLINDANNQLTCTGNFRALTLTPTSDRNAKENFEAVDPQAILEKVAALPITEWNFKAEAGVKHVGPVAQDFRAAFAVGMDDKHIATVDADGVALAAIQGLNRKLEEREASLRAENAELKNELNQLKALVKNSLCREQADRRLTP